MRALKGTLTFILGMIMGVILFIVAIAGTLYAVATSIKIGQLQDNIGIQIFDEDSATEDKTLWEVGKDLIEDIRGDITSLTLNELAQKYGLNNKLDLLNGYVGAIDFSPIFDVPIKDIGNSLSVIVDNITLDDIGELAGIDFNTYGLPVLKDNLYVGITKAIDSILNSIDGDNITLRQIEDNFGLTLGNNQIFTLIKDSPLSAFGDLIDGMEVGMLLDTDCDLFVKSGSNSVYVKSDRYEEVSASDYVKLKEGATAYVSGTDEQGKLIYKELRFKVKTVVNAEGVDAEVKDENGNTVYVVDNASNKEGFTADAENPVTYYRYVEYEPYSSSATYDSDTIFYIPAFANHYVAGATAYELKQDGYIALTNIYSDRELTTSLNSAVTNGAVDISVSNFRKSADTTPVALALEGYGLNPEKYLGKDSRLEKGYDECMLLVHSGSADSAIQAIAHISVSGLNNATDSLMSVKLSDLITIDESSPQILQSIKDKTLNELSSSIDDLVLGDVIDIYRSLFIEDVDGIYVFVPAGTNYRQYNQLTDNGVDRFALTYVQSEDGDYIKIAGKYYLYDADDAAANAARDDAEFYKKSYAVDAEGDYVVDKQSGYYTLYIPSEHVGETRYSKIIDKNDSVNPDYFVATESQLNDGAVQKYYFNTATKEMQTDIIANTTAYVKGESSSIVLQRLAEVAIGDFSTAFTSLILGDVLDINVDTFSTVDNDYISSNPFEDYYYFDNGLYKLADNIYRDANPDAVIYALDKVGDGNAILKKLALIKIDEISAKMDDIVDSLFLADVIDVVNDAYIADNAGAYVYVADGKYYTLYNAAVHDSTAQRYSKYIETVGNADISYSIATEEQIEAGVGLYYYDSALGSMCEYTTGELGALYVQAEASAKVLQRLARTPIAKFNDTFKTLYIGDVMDIEIDIYEKVADNYSAFNPIEGTEYFYYDNGIYLTAYPSDASWQVAHADDAIYVIYQKGDGNAVIKRMAFIPIEDIGNRMDAVIDDIALGDVVDVTTDFYYADEDGIFVFVPSGKYYTLYNPAVHDEIAQRYSKYTDTVDTTTFSYLTATEEQIEDININKYYWDSVLNKMVAYASGDYDALYVRGTASSMTLQRFVNVKIGKFSDEFSTLILSDVIAIDGDVYQKVNGIYITENPDLTYYYYDNGVYRIADAEFRGANPLLNFYRITIVGESHVVIKKMAYLPVDALGSRMTDIIDDLYLADLIDIYEYDEVKPSDIDINDPSARWIVSPNQDYTEVIDNKTYEYTFVYDTSGKYYLKDVQYIALTEDQLSKFDNAGNFVQYDYSLVFTKKTGTITSEDVGLYGLNNNLIDVAWNDEINKIAALKTLADHNGYCYYLGTDSNYHLNTALCLYLFTNGNYDNVYYRDTTRTNFSGNTWNNFNNGDHKLLYVEFMGEYVEYDATNPAHADLQKYLRLTNGFSLPAASETGEYYYDTSKQTITNSYTENCIDMALTQVANMGTSTTPLYYFVKLDNEFNALKEAGTPPVTFSKQACSDIYVEAASGEYVYFNGDYILASALDENQKEGLTLLRKASGYLARLNEVSLTDSSETTRTSFLSDEKVVVTKEQSAPVLKAFARDNVKVSTLDKSIKEFTIGDMMDVAPDSMFDDSAIRNAKIDELSVVFQNKLQSMTIGDILDWGNITTLNATVMSVIRDATLENFFDSLEYSPESGAITVNIIKLYGYSK